MYLLMKSDTTHLAVIYANRIFPFVVSSPFNSANLSTLVSHSLHLCGSPSYVDTMSLSPCVLQDTLILVNVASRLARVPLIISSILKDINWSD